ncbi:MAG: DUF47 family protein [Erysipelotrichales bacterium]
MIGAKRKEDEFFVHLQEFAALIVESTDSFKDLVYDYKNKEEKIAIVKEYETKCDNKAHEMTMAIHESFITPFDREDLYVIIKQMDDIVDCIEQVASRLNVFDIKELNDNFKEMTDLICKAVAELEQLFISLPSFKKRGANVKKNIIEVNCIENEGDLVYRRILTDLFKEEKDPIELIKWKHLYEQLEDCLDSCEGVANTIEGVVVKYV